jgi:DNA polymerase-1
LRVYKEIELPLVPVLFDMEACGVMLDESVLSDISVEINKEIDRLTKEIFAIANREFNISSPAQLAEVLEELNIEVGKKTKTGKVSTSADVLEELAEQYELPRLVLDFRELTKLQNTYVVALPKSIDPRTGRIHTTFNQTIAATGRLSSINPNLQNIPVRSSIGKRIRAAFVPAKGCQILSADYSQIELRLLAHIAEDPAMTASFKNNEDVHAATAEAVFGAKTKKEQGEKRRLAKIVNFAIAYSVGAFGLAQRTGLSRKEAKEVIDNYFATYPGIKRYMDEIPEKAREGGVVRTLSGRIRPIPDINSANHGLRARAEREAINAPIQGTAADIIKIAMIRIAESLKREHLKTKMILQVHDELVFEVPTDEIDCVKAMVKDLMENAMELDVPLVVDVGVGKNWMEAKP